MRSPTMQLSRNHILTSSALIPFKRIITTISGHGQYAFGNNVSIHTHTNPSMELLIRSVHLTP